MSKVYSFHMISLKAGASGPDFEQYFQKELKSWPMLSGMSMRLLKGDRGDREGKYLVMFEFDSVERRNQLFPEAGPAARQSRTSSCSGWARRVRPWRSGTSSQPRSM